MAGIAALEQCRDEVNAQRAVYQERRDRIVAGLNSLPGFSCVEPRGAFYAFPNVTRLGIPSAELARQH
jgi:aspartate/methionine/tyrosine aminotransferase